MKNLPNENPAQPPLISIIIPFFNREAFLSECVESVIAQTFSDWELILVDDGSSDKSNEIARQYADSLPGRVTVLQHPGNMNLGASAARNLGVAHARGTYLTFLDSDDVFYPFTLERELEGFSRFPDADAVCGTADVWYTWKEDNAARGKDFKIDLVLKTNRLYEPPLLFLHNLNASGRKPHFNCTLLKQSFIKRIGAFEEDFKSVGEDQALWAKVSLNGRIYILDDSLAKYRQHPDSTCANLLKSGVDIDHWSRFLTWLEDYLSKNEIEDPEVWSALQAFKKRHAVQKKIRVVKNLYRRLLPLHLRYRFRDWKTRFNEMLTRSAHRKE